MTKQSGEWALIVASLAAIAVTACGRGTEPPPALPAAATPPTASSPPVVASGGGTPANAPPATASDGGGPADAPTATHAERRDPLRPMTPAEESKAMPKPGQANDHSNPSAEPVPSTRQEPAR